MEKNKMETKVNQQKDQFNQLCVMEGALFPEGLKEEEEEGIKEFHQFFKDKFNVRVKFENQIKTLPNMKDGKPVPETGGRSDLFFYIHDDDIHKFAKPRSEMGIRWWEDVLANGNGKLYDNDVLEAYPYLWGKNGGNDLDYYGYKFLTNHISYLKRKIKNTANGN